MADMDSAALPKRVPVGTRVITRWGPATVTRDWWPDDPNYEIIYDDGEHGAFTLVTPLDSLLGQRLGALYGT